MIGQKFGRLTVIERAPSKNGRSRWTCKCDCGNIRTVISSNLLRGTSRSCGCYQRENMSKIKTTHGGCANKDPLYNVWTGMRKRCNSNTDPHYKDYGQRGICVCDEWKLFETFKEWATDSGYTPGRSIDRVDVNGNYCPENCRWATPAQQQNNRRSCLYYTHDGHTHTLKEWSRILNINYSTLYSRITRYNMAFCDAIVKP